MIKGELRQAYIVVSRNIEEAVAEAKDIAKAAVCRAAREMGRTAVCRGAAPHPCRVCSACRKVDAGVHPDVKTIVRELNDSGKLKKELVVDQVREVAADAQIMPNESEHKVYIFADGDFMNVQAQNAALKLLEEPPEGVVLIICVTSAEKLLTTVRSRCAVVNLCGTVSLGGETGEKKAGAGGPKPDASDKMAKAEAEEKADRDEGAGLAEEYLAKAAERNPAGLWKWCEGANGLSGAGMDEFCGTVEKLVADMLCFRRPDMGLSVVELTGITSLMEKCRDRLRVNTGVKHLFGMLSAETPLCVQPH